MTSGNVSDEPIAFRDDDALARLAGIADVLLVHDRPIETRTDDSVVRAVRAGGRPRPLLLRRSRGYVPAALELPVTAPQHVLGCGAELKNTFCVARGGRAWVGHHIGDLTNAETLRSFEEGIEHVGRLFGVEPAVVAHDLHPDYLSTAYALAREGVELVGVQHHHAHLAACLAEHGERGPAVGAIFDGTGYGIDGTVWGGELLIGGLDGFERPGHLMGVRMPGGDQAVRQPWRMACAWLVAALDDDEPAPQPALAAAVDRARWRAVAGLARGGLAAPVTTSVGRLCDAVAALCGVRAEVRYEGQAAIELEAVADPSARGAYPLDVVETRPPDAPVEGPAGTADGAGTGIRRAAGTADGSTASLVLDARPTVLAVVADVAAGVLPGVVAARFHAALAAATAGACARLAGRAGLDTVVLSGGVFQNRRLLEGTAAALDRVGLRVLVPEKLPPNDGGIAYGQVAVAAARAG
jgi:hydrogenase maturation protein HypF